MKVDDRRRVVAAIHPMHSFAAGVRALLEIQREFDLIADSFFGRQRLARLIIRDRVLSEAD